MRSPFQSLVIGAIAAAFAIASTGCFFKGAKARHLERGDKYYAAGKFDEAEIEYRNVLKVDPFNPAVIGKLGILYYEQGRLTRIFPFLAKARELQPDNLEVRTKLAMFYGSIGRWKESRDEALHVLERRPDDPECPVLLAETAFQTREMQEVRERLNALPAAAQQGTGVVVALAVLDLRQRKFADAQSALERALAADPKASIVPFILGALYAAQNDRERAEKYYAQAATLSPMRSNKRVRHAHYMLQSGKVDAARAALEEMTTAAPDYIPAQILLADILGNLMKLDEGLSAIGKALSRDAAHPEAMLIHGRLLVAKGEKEKAISELERAVGQYPQSSQLHHQLGAAYFANNDLARAIASLTQAVTLAPTSTGSILLLAEVNMRQRNFANAVTALKQLLQKQPELVPARLLLADALRAQGNLNEALTVYRELAAAAPKNAQVQQLMGMVYIQQRKLAEARATFTKALEVDPDFIPALEQLVNIDLFEKNYARARGRMQKQIERQPKAAGLYYTLARIYLAESDIANAEATLLKSIEIQPDLPLPYLALARIYINAKDTKKALANLELAAAKNTKQIEPLMLAAVIYSQQKEHAKARDAYEKILAINPKFSPALNNLAWLYSEEFNEVEKAYELAQKARELLPTEAHAADTLGWILYKKRQYPWALTLLSESADRLPTSIEVQYHLGMTHYMMGDENAARVTLERALHLSTTFPGAAEARQCLAIIGINPATAGDEQRATLEKAVAQRPDPVAIGRLGRIYERNGMIDKAAASYESALKMSPNNVTAAVNLIRVQRAKKETAKALELAKATRKLAPTDASVAHALGQLVFDTGDYSWALSLLQEALRKTPNDPEIQYDVAMASYAVGQVAAAEAGFGTALQAKPSFERADRAKQSLELIRLSADPAAAAAGVATAEKVLKAEPNNVPAMMVVGTAAQHRGDVQAARQSFEKALARYPDFTPAHRQLAIIHSKTKGDSAKALEHATKARAVFPDDPELAKAFGVIVFRQGNFGRAQSLLQESARRLANDPEVMFYLGMAQHQLKSQTASVASLKRALELGLSGDLAVEANRLLSAAK